MTRLAAHHFHLRMVVNEAPHGRLKCLRLEHCEEVRTQNQRRSLGNYRQLRAARATHLRRRREVLEHHRRQPWVEIMERKADPGREIVWWLAHTLGRLSRKTDQADCAAVEMALKRFESTK